MAKDVRAKAPRNAASRAMRDPLYRPRVERKLKGKASYTRKGRDAGRAAPSDSRVQRRRRPTRGTGERRPRRPATTNVVA